MKIMYSICQSGALSIMQSEHPVGIGGLFRNLLDHVPVLVDLAVLEPEYLDDCAPSHIGGTYGMNMENDIVTIRQDPLDLASGFRKIRFEEFDEGLEPLRAVCHQWIVLFVSVPHIFSRRFEVFLVNDEVVELLNCFFVGFGI